MADNVDYRMVRRKTPPGDGGGEVPAAWSLRERLVTALSSQEGSRVRWIGGGYDLTSGQADVTVEFEGGRFLVLVRQV